jgi:hypothetical protein
MRLINIVCGRSAVLLTFKARGTYSDHSLLNGVNNQ